MSAMFQISYIREYAVQLTNLIINLPI
ncbi:hypothetical protein SPHINGOT1_200036 [Sphingomonas sp. T1]|nr:hypothetical protein SPHINGOT1_200036 [Sphingomonas sp. T1]